jgi:hypothetical protein
MKSPGSMGPDPWNTSAAIKSQIVFSRPNIEDIGILCMNSQWVSEWLLSNSNFSAILWQEKVNFQWDDDESALYQTNMLNWYLYSASSLKQQFAGRHVAPLGHIILIPSQPVFSLSRRNKWDESFDAHHSNEESRVYGSRSLEYISCN